MSMTQLAKSLHQRAINLLCGERIVFHHVPKCGGTSVARALRRAYILSQGTVTPAESEKAFDAIRDSRAQQSIGNVSDLREMMLVYMLYCDVRCVAAHIPFSEVAFERFNARYVFVTVLRDPVERFISNYFWSHKRPVGIQHIPEGLEEFLLTDRAQRLGATYARYFSGEPAAKTFTTKHVDAAVRNLRRMDFVGFLDEVPGIEEALRHLTGCRLNIGRENVASGSENRDQILSGPLRESILAACSVDRDIWDAVQDLRNGRAERGGEPACAGEGMHA